ncbi:MFS transporter [Streptomyces kanamyceticus]|uniref:MFS transporter n=1 Tax=Streptomyces kanamyceticus TaxID=1967 RepID=A0A5J6GNQ8_STRKN|nr:MFS transporter [Streptomyces kanamyceticus]QEU96907.1 MFS transporter [Streptomyces kanamyceticus]
MKPPDTGTGPATRKQLPLVLRNPAFGAVWTAQVLTQAAARMFQVGVVWWLVSQAAGADRGLASGAFLAISTLPAVALVPLVARVVARCPHRSVLAGAAAVAGLAAAATATWTYAAQPPTVVIYSAALLLAGCQALFDPCLTTSVPELVEDADIEAATGFELATQSLAGLAGGLLGPLLVDAWDLAGIVAGCAGAYLVAAVLVASARFPRAAAGPAAHAPGDVPQRRTLRQILAELPFIRQVLLCFAAANVFTTAVYVVMPLYTRSVLHGQGSTVAALEAALGAGTLLGSFTGGRLPGSPTAIGGTCLALMALALGMPGLAPGLTVALVSLLLAGWCVGVIGVRFVALFQRSVPAADKPGFFAVMQAVLGATFPLSSLVFGVLGDHLGARWLCLVQGVGLAPVAVALFLLGRRGRAAAEDGTAAPTVTAPTGAQYAADDAAPLGAAR